MAHHKHRETFNGKLKFLLTGLKKMYPKDTEISRLGSRASLAIGVNPLSLMKSAGPVLAKYQTQIDQAAKSGDDSFFLEGSYDADLKGVEADDAKLAVRLIGLIQQAWPGLDPGQKDEYRKAVKAMLDAYLDYEIDAPR